MQHPVFYLALPAGADSLRRRSDNTVKLMEPSGPEGLIARVSLLVSMLHSFVEGSQPIGQQSFPPVRLNSVLARALVKIAFSSIDYPSVAHAKSDEKERMKQVSFRLCSTSYRVWLWW